MLRGSARQALRSLTLAQRSAASQASRQSESLLAPSSQPTDQICSISGRCMSSGSIWSRISAPPQQAAFSAKAAGGKPGSETSDGAAASHVAADTGDTAEADTLAAAEASKQQSAPSATEAEEQVEAQSAASTSENLEKQLLERDQMLLEKDGQIEEASDRALRALADLENIRDRSARQAETTRKFAVQGFAKAMLEVADNLERALDLADKPAQTSNAADQLRSLQDGLRLTDKILLQVFKQNGIERYTALDQKFDPNLHSALFEVPDPSKPGGTVAIVTKAGYKLHDRVLRPAEVGVVQAHSGDASPSTQ